MILKPQPQLQVLKLQPPQEQRYLVLPLIKGVSVYPPHFVSCNGEFLCQGSYLLDVNVSSNAQGHFRMLKLCYKQTHISILFSYHVNPFSSQICKINSYKNIFKKRTIHKHQTFSELVPSILPLLK